MMLVSIEDPVVSVVSIVSIVSVVSVVSHGPRVAQRDEGKQANGKRLPVEERYSG